jgi:hypothetical protein
MFNNPTLWSSLGFGVLVVGLVGDILVIALVPSGKLEKALAILCTLVVIAGVTVEHLADNQRFGPRALSNAESAQIGATLKSYAGQQFEITTYWDMKEAHTFANEIATALVQSAGWKYIPPTRFEAMLGGVEGVLVYVHPEAHDNTKRAAEALVRVLNNMNIQSELRWQNDPGHPTERVHLNVGSKPE